jgi:GNAT superfamily N-acetyltransferase
VWESDTYGGSLFDACDSYSGSTCEYYSAIYDLEREGRLRCELEEMFPQQGSYNTLIIDLLEIEPEFRGRKLGLRAMRKAMRTWGRNCGLVIIKPLPLQHRRDSDEEEEKIKNTPEFAADLQRLVIYYEQLGFKKIAETEYYALSLEDELTRV